MNVSRAGVGSSIKTVRGTKDKSKDKDLKLESGAYCSSNTLGYYTQRLDRTNIPINIVAIRHCYYARFVSNNDRYYSSKFKEHLALY